MGVILLVRQTLYDVLHHNDRTIHEHADSNGQSTEAHEIRGQPGHAHEQERHQRGHRQCDRNDRGGSPVTEENDQKDHDQDGRFQQRFLNRSNRSADQIGPIVEDRDVRSGWKATLDLCQTVFDAGHNLPCIGTAKSDHKALDRLCLAVLGASGFRSRHSLHLPGGRYGRHGSL